MEVDAAPIPRREDMTRLSIILSLAIMTTACVATAQPFGARASGPARSSSAAPADAGEGDGFGSDEDEHWFTADDYLVAPRAYEGRKLVSVKVAKMLAAPSGETKTEARFLLASGKELWTAHYWRSRVATDSDLAIGNLLFCPARAYQKRVEVPDRKDKARQGPWILAAVTDTSDRYKGQIGVGDVTCDIRALRAILE
jgi:hypothetical protein